MHDTFPDTALPQAANWAIEAGDPRSSFAHYESAIHQGAADPATLGNYGVLLWRMYEFRKGSEAFAQVVDDSHADTGMLRRIAHCYFEIGRFSQAAEVMRVALSRMPRPDAATTNTLAWTLERDHQIDEARQLAGRGPRPRPLVRTGRAAARPLDFRAGDLEGAASRLRNQLHPSTSELDWALRYELASICDRLGQNDEAWTVLCEAKAQLSGETPEHLRESHFIRRRQWELTQSVTPADLRRWRQAGESLAPLKRIAFLTGFPRSGTTLLEQIIATNADTIATDESGILARQFIQPLVWQAADVMDAIIELRSFDAEQLTAGRESFYQMTESYLDQPIGRAAAD